MTSVTVHYRLAAAHKNNSTLHIQGAPRRATSHTFIKELVQWFIQRLNGSERRERLNGSERRERLNGSERRERLNGSTAQRLNGSTAQRLNGSTAQLKAGKIPLHLLCFILFFGIPVMVQSQNTFPTNGHAGQGIGLPVKAIHIHSNTTDNSNDPTLLLTDGTNPSGPGTYSFNQIQASFSLLTTASRPIWNIGAVSDALLQSGWQAGDLFLAVRNPEKHMLFHTGNAERMILNKDGLLGVGTTTPRHRVTVSDHWDPIQLGLNSRSITLNKWYDQVFLTSKNNTRLAPSLEMSLDVPSLANNLGFTILINRNNTADNGNIPWQGNVIRLLENGNVGIGANTASDVVTPTARLVIQAPARTNNERLTAFRIRNSDGVEQFRIADDGFMMCQEIKVAVPASGDWTWADYVFKKDYKLMPLREVESFINENGHLPGVPSSDQVQKNGGVEVSRIQAKLLEKIEELTLHLIRLEKELEAAKSQLNQQNKGEGR